MESIDTLDNYKCHENCKKKKEKKKKMLKVAEKKRYYVVGATKFEAARPQ